LTSECRATLIGSDDFNDNSKDTNRWGTDIILGTGGIFTETNQRLEYTTGGSSSSANILRP
jgi:hypothetical protein